MCAPQQSIPYIIITTIPHVPSYISKCSVLLEAYSVALYPCSFLTRSATAATRAAPRPLPSSDSINWYWKSLLAWWSNALNFPLYIQPSTFGRFELEKGRIKLYQRLRGIGKIAYLKCKWKFSGKFKFNRSFNPYI